MPDERGFFRRWGLIVPAVLAPVAETVALAVLGARDALSMAAQITAPAPLDLFHDLRWISVYHNSWPILALQILAVLFLRGLWAAWVVQRSWPERDAPAMGTAAWRAGIYLVVASLLLLPFVVLLFGLAVTHLSFLYFAAIPPVLAIALAIHTGAASQAAGDWWRWRPTLPGLAWMAASFVWLTVAGATARVAPLPLAALVAAAAGLANARAWYGIVQSVAHRPDRRRVPGLVPVALVTIFTVVVGGSAIGFAVTTGGDPRAVGRAAAPPDVAAGDRPVLVAAGTYSRYEHPTPIHLPRGNDAWRFSYRGLDEMGLPLPYDPSDTLRPVTESARRMAEQVDVLAEAYGKPVTLVAESQGALVARTFVTLFPRSARSVDRLITLELPAGAPSVYVPPRGEVGWGVGTAWVLRGVTWMIDEMAPFEVSVDAPVLRNLVDCRSLVHRALGSPAPAHIQEVSIEALADWVDRPLHRPRGVEVHVVTAPHSGLIDRAGVRATIGEILLETETRRAGRRPSVVAGLISHLASPWRTPALDVQLFPRRDCRVG